MKVYIVYGYDYDGISTIGVYASEHDAIAMKCSCENYIADNPRPEMPKELIDSDDYESEAWDRYHEICSAWDRAHPGGNAALYTSHFGVEEFNLVPASPQDSING